MVEEIPVTILTTKTKKGKMRLANSLPSWSKHFEDVRVFNGVTANMLSENDPRISNSTRMNILKMRRKKYFAIGVSDPIQNLSQVACALSHIAIWQQVVDKNEATIVVEDDTVFLGEKQDVLEALRTNAHFVSLAASANPQATLVLDVVHDFYGFQVYFIAPVGAAFLLKNAIPVNAHIDRYLASEVFTHRNYNFIIAQPQLKVYEQRSVSQLDHASDMTLSVVAPLIGLCVILLLLCIWLVSEKTRCLQK